MTHQNGTATHRSGKATHHQTAVDEDGASDSFYATISLRTGRAMGSPIVLPPATQTAGLVGPAVLAVLTTARDVLLFDTIRGAPIYSCRPLPTPSLPSDPASDGGCALVTDAKRSRLAIVFETLNATYAVAYASVRADSTTSTTPYYLFFGRWEHATLAPRAAPVAGGGLGLGSGHGLYSPPSAAAAGGAPRNLETNVRAGRGHCGPQFERAVRGGAESSRERCVIFI